MMGGPKKLKIPNNSSSNVSFYDYHDLRQVESVREKVEKFREIANVSYANF